MRTWWSAALLLPCLVLPGCSECFATQCGALPPAIRLTVNDAVDGGPVLGAMANGFLCPAVCTPGLADGGRIEAPGTFSVAVAAAGYQPQRLEVVIPASADPGTCCPLLYVPQEREARLVPL